MGKFRTVALVLFALGMVILMIATWGSIGSAVMGMCLITMISALLFQRFLTNRNGDDFQMED